MKGSVGHKPVGKTINIEFEWAMLFFISGNMMVWDSLSVSACIRMI